MMKWIGRSIYILVLLLFISVSVYRIAYTAKLQIMKQKLKIIWMMKETPLRGLIRS